ncbi:zinc metalloprotease HtpX [Halobacteriales archaeon QH_2_66_30]|nr:MAG: zinc metalloprotease HtpX [Halobacteriales archaeon QH_2_66_30]
MKRRYDWGLGVRMVLALLVLGGLYIGLGYAAALLFGFFVAAPGLGHFAGIAVAVLLLAGSQYYFGANLALRTMGADVVEREEYPDLHDRVTYLAQQAGVPKPRVAVADNETPNAFAAGRKQGNAVVCVTTGLLEELDDEELDGVLAHELAHIMHRDFQLMTVIAALVVWVGAFLVGRLISRYREFAADRGAATITGNPAALASALETISDEIESVPEEDLREAERASALLAAEVRETKLSRLFRTHPAVENRVAKLREQAVDMDA